MSDAGEQSAESEGQGRTERIAAVRRRFGEVAALPDEAIDLAEGALLIAAEEYPQLDLDAYRGRLDALAGRVRRRLEQARDEGLSGDADESALRSLHQVLFDEEGFAGTSQEEYSDPRNSYLNEVLDRKRGLPITLAVVYCEVARRAGLEAVGIGLPGHYIVQFRGGHLSAFVDPFNGGARLEREDCAALIGRALGAPVELTPEQLMPATRKATLARILNNLKGHHLQHGQLTKALSAVERIMLLQASIDQVRDRGLILRRMGLMLMKATNARGAERREAGARRAAPDAADLLVAQQFLSAAWLDLKLYAREGAAQPDAEAVQEAADALWKRMARLN